MYQPRWSISAFPNVYLPNSVCTSRFKHLQAPSRSPRLGQFQEDLTTALWWSAGFSLMLDYIRSVGRLWLFPLLICLIILRVAWKSCAAHSRLVTAGCLELLENCLVPSTRHPKDSVSYYGANQRQSSCLSRAFPQHCSCGASGFWRLGFQHLGFQCLAYPNTFGCWIFANCRPRL